MMNGLDKFLLICYYLNTWAFCPSTTAREKGTPVEGEIRWQGAVVVILVVIVSIYVIVGSTLGAIAYNQNAELRRTNADLRKKINEFVLMDTLRHDPWSFDSARAAKLPPNEYAIARNAAIDEQMTRTVVNSLAPTINLTESDKEMVEYEQTGDAWMAQVCSYSLYDATRYLPGRSEIEPRLARLEKAMAKHSVRSDEDAESLAIAHDHIEGTREMLDRIDREDRQFPVFDWPLPSFKPDE